MKSIVVVGSGPSGIHFALSALRKGHAVHMLDVGHGKSVPVHQGESFNDLKENLSDPVEYFLGSRFESIVYPDREKEFYDFPPSKRYVFRSVDAHRHQARGFSPLFSFAKGGLAETWTAGSYPFNGEELSEFPFSYRDLEPHYSEVARRIGINGVDDDLAQFFPVHDNLLPPMPLDKHGNLLWYTYERNKRRVNETHGCFLGHSRLAVLSNALDGRSTCTSCGRCLWGCPNGAFYTPSLSLPACHQYPNFRYEPEVCVSHFEVDAANHINEVVGRSTRTGETIRRTANRLVLAAGTLMSSKIFMESVRRATGEVLRLGGLMDNRQVFVPFINLRMIGKQFNPDSYQYHQLAMGLPGANGRDYIHCQITTLKTSLIHPIVQLGPFDLATSLFLLRHMHAALGLLNVNFCDTRRETNYLTLEPRGEGEADLVIDYTPPAHETRTIKRALKRVKGALRLLGCIVPPMMTHVRPMGASVHYAGTLPMSSTKKPLTTSPLCQSHDFPNLYFVDGTTFPFLPAKNITFTLMANAVRVAESAF